MASEYTIEEIEAKVNNAIQCLMEKDVDLLYIDANERSISHKLGEYLQQEFCDWHVDCEYNRDLTDTKRLKGLYNDCKPDDIEAKTVFPDIVVHLRQSNDNLLVIEIKKASNRDGTTKDRRKLEAFTGDEYRYRFGLLLEFGVGGNPSSCEKTWFIEGSQFSKSAKRESAIRSNLKGMGYG